MSKMCSKCKSVRNEEVDFFNDNRTGRKRSKCKACSSAPKVVKLYKCSRCPLNKSDMNEWDGTNC